MARYSYDSFPRASRPRPASGGIKARNQHGSFGKNWWAKRWIEALESFSYSNRLQRGRSYARSGQVLKIAIAPGNISAQVQGSRARPYEVTIALAAFSPSQLAPLKLLLPQHLPLVGKLLAGEMPPETEELFASAQLALFPRRHGDLRTTCSCPDSSNPCKHVAAVYYLLAEEFGGNPFLLLELRGLAREALLHLLQDAMLAQSPAEVPVGGAATPAVTERGHPVPLGAEKPPLPTRVAPEAEANQFWQGLPIAFEGEGAAGYAAGERLNVVGDTAKAPDMVLVRRLGPFPFWSGEVEFMAALQPAYARASASAQALLSGEWQLPNELPAAELPDSEQPAAVTTSGVSPPAPVRTGAEPSLRRRGRKPRAAWPASN